jgi:uncharacterized protein (UPF0303 family)
MKKTFVLFASFAFAILAHSQKVSKKLQFAQGQVYEIGLETKTTVSQEAMGQAIDFNVDGNASHTYKVTNSTGDNSTLHHEVKKIGFNFEGMGQKRSFDSDKPKDMEGPFGKPVKDLLTKTFDMIVDTAGKVLMLQPEKVQEVVIDERMKLITGMLKDVMDVVQPPKKGTPSFFMILPDNEVGKGDTWNEVSTIEGGKSSRTYTLTDITDSTLIVDFTGTSTTVTKAEMMGMETTTTMNDKATGQIILDKATGIIRQKKVTIESTGNTEAMGGSMPVTSKTTVVITIKPQQ